MTKPTQQQSTLKMINSKNQELYKDLVYENIKSVYPDVNIINMTYAIHSYKNVISNVKQMNELTKHDNNIIIVFNINTLNFTKFHSRYMRLNKVSSITWPKIDDDVAVMLIRSIAVILYSKPVLINSDVINNTLKGQLKPYVNECLICCNEFDVDDKRVTCCHCMMPMCKDCFMIYIKENPGWCPYCTQHLIYHGKSK